MFRFDTPAFTPEDAKHQDHLVMVEMAVSAIVVIVIFAILYFCGS